MGPDVSDHESAKVYSASGEQSLADLLEWVTRQLDDGRIIDVETLIREHPHYDTRLRELMPAMLAMASWGRSSSAAEDDDGGDSSSSLASVLGDFRILRELGRGGMGTVFEAEQLSMGRRVALKVLPFANLAQDKAIRRFRNEVRAAAALDHPHIVSVYSVGEERGIHYYAMQLIAGPTLAEVIHAQRMPGQVPLATAEAGPGDATPPIDSAVALPQSTTRGEQAEVSTAIDSRRDTGRYRRVAQLGIQAAEALQHAHDQGVLHRDIKPGNLLLDSEGKLYVTDFGLARIEADAGMTMTGDILGTLRYMAPEQALAKRAVIDHRADIYSLGATLYELLTLQPAFGETDRSELLKQIAFEEPTPLRKRDRHIPAELETIILAAMAKSPDERYQTAQGLADDLNAYLDDRPIQAKPPTLLERGARWSRRHVAAVWAAIAFLLAVTLILATASARIARSYEELARQRDIAEGRLIEAQTNARMARSTSEFLLHVIDSANPDSSTGSEFTMRELLDAFSAQLRDNFADQPEVEAEIHQTIGRAYSRLGVPDRADKHLAAALQLKRQHLGDRHPAVADTLAALATHGYRRKPRAPYEEIIADAQEALDIYRKNSSPSEQMINAYTPLIHALASQGRNVTGDYLAAEVVIADALEAAGDLDRVENPLVAVILHTQAILHREQGRFEEAEAAARLSVSLHRRLHGNHHPETAWGLQHLGHTLQDKGSFSEALDLYEEAYRIRCALYPIEHSERRGGLFSLLSLLKDLEQHSRYDALLNEAATAIDERLRRSPDIPACWNFRAWVHYTRGSLDDAIRCLDEAIERTRAPQFLLNRAYLYAIQGRIDAAEADFAECVAIGPRSARRLNAVAWRLARFDCDAPPLAELAIELSLQACELTNYEDVGVIDTLAAAYARAGNFENAVRWSRKAVGLLSHSGPHPLKDNLEKFESGLPLADSDSWHWSWE